MNSLAAGSVDVVVTSPPYNLGIKYGKYQDSLSAEDYLQWTSTWAAATTRLLKEHDSLFLNLGGCPSNPCCPFKSPSRWRSS